MAALMTTSRPALADHLAALGVVAGMDVVVHSKLISFGRIDGGAETVLAALRTAVGPAGTLVFPSYTFDTADNIYDPGASPSTGVGALSELARCQPGTVRSLCPIHNHVALGPRAAVLTESQPSVSLGPGSDFDMLHRAGFHLLLLGCSFDEGATFLHHMEAVAQVPYRRWLPLERRLLDPADGLERTMICRYYGSTGQSMTTRFDVMIEPLRTSGCLSEARAPYGPSYRVDLDNLYHCAYRLLAGCPLALAIPDGVS